MAATMASSLFSLAVKPNFAKNALRFSSHSTVPPSQFVRKASLTLSSSSTISSLAPLVLGNDSSFPSSSLKNSNKSLTIVCAKGYKMKTHKASAKRFRVTGAGKIIRRRAGKSHLLRKKNAKRRKRLSKMVQVDRSDYDNVIGALPYLKVNRAK